MKFELNEADMHTLRTGSLIERIRVFRNVTGWGLKMSHDACQGIMSGRVKLEEFFTPKSPCLACQGTGFVAEKVPGAALAAQDPAETERLRLLDLVEKLKCSEKAQECTARHMGYNLAIDDVLELLREPLKQSHESAAECPALLMQPGPIKKCGLRAGHDGGCAEVLEDKQNDETGHVYGSCSRVPCPICKRIEDEVRG